MTAPDRRVALPVLAAAAIAAACAGVAYAAFGNSTSSSGSSFSAKRIFPGSRTMIPFDLRDAAGGSETNKTDPLAYADAVISTTSAWATTFAANRYLEFTLSSPLAAGKAVSGVTFDFRMIPNLTTDTACWYFEVYRASTSTLLGTHGSTSTPVACATGTTYTTVSTTLSEISSSTDANDLRVRLYGKESNSVTRPMKIDLATVSGTLEGSPFTLQTRIYNDQADTTAATTTWGVAVAGDGASYQSASTWTTAFASTRYLKLTYPTSHVPSGSVVTAATFDHSYRSATSGAQFCYYFEVYDGGSLIGTHGSSGSPVSCNSSSTTWVSDSVSLPEVNTVARANNVVIKLYGKSSTSKASQHDSATVAVTYSLD